MISSGDKPEKRAHLTIRMNASSKATSCNEQGASEIIQSATSRRKMQKVRKCASAPASRRVLCRACGRDQSTLAPLGPQEPRAFLAYILRNNHIVLAAAGMRPTAKPDKTTDAAWVIAPCMCLVTCCGMSGTRYSVSSRSKNAARKVLRLRVIVIVALACAGAPSAGEQLGHRTRHSRSVSGFAQANSDTQH
jgi:hypothetical protein